jgi:NAD(P)-dependent dehydrogenase (short-subunit alcohol dehydrogenase family)/acyl carrier protein
MAEAADKWKTVLQEHRFTSPRLPVFSNLSAEPYPSKSGDIADLLGKHLHSPVRFTEQIQNMKRGGTDTFVEIGPGRVLCGLSKAITGNPAEQSIALAGSGSGTVDDFISAMGKLWVLGFPVDIAPLFRVRHIAMPPAVAKASATLFRVNGGCSLSTTAPEKVQSDKPVLHLGGQPSADSQPPQTGIPATAPAAMDSSRLQMISSFQDTMSSFLDQQESAQRERKQMMQQMWGMQESLFSMLTGGQVQQPAAQPVHIPTVDSAVLPVQKQELPKEAPPAFNKPNGAVTQIQAITTITSSAEEDVSSMLLSVVSDRTGYPADMLSPEQHLESDLGIDSIKRVEILSAFEEKLPDLPPISPDSVATLKTLGQIVDVLSPTGPASARTQEPVPPENKLIDFPRRRAGKTKETRPGDWPAEIERQCVQFQETSFQPGPALGFSVGQRIYIVSAPEDELAAALQVRLADRGVEISRLAFSEAADAALDPADAAGLVLVAQEGLPREGDALYQAPFVKDAFAAVHRFAPRLVAAAEEGAAIFASVSRMDGRFGFSGEGRWSPLSAGLAGIAKTSCQEWPGTVCRAFDVPADCAQIASASEAIANELLTPAADGAVEIGLLPGKNSLRRMVPVLVPEYPEAETDLQLNLAPGDVVVVSGGARGITAAATRALAEAIRPTLVILGRSPAVFEEPAWLENAVEPAEVKKAVFENEFQGTAAPTEVERAFRRYRANRELAASLKGFKEAGARVFYHSTDIRNRLAVAKVLTQVKQQHGPVRAVIHAAGVLEDRFIADKRPEQFQRVFDTKVGGLGSLLQAVDPQQLRYLVLFSSVAARMGNPGQADYAAANEVLNKIAQQTARRLPDCRCLSINWGPWDGGMVTPSLKRAFADRGIDLIAVDAGVRCLLLEMGRGSADGPVEVVVGARLTPRTDSKAAPQAADKKGLSLAFKQQVAPESHRVLKSHVIDGSPVVPFALMAEWMGYGALHENPGLLLCGLRDVRLLKGLRLNGGEKVIRLMAGRAVKNEAAYEVGVEVRDGIVDGKETIHARGTVLLAENLPPAPEDFDLQQHLSAESYGRSTREIYNQILFHGRALQGIRRVLSSTRRSMAASIEAAPLPAEWVDQPLRSRWIMDPLVLDCAFQMAILWCYDHEGMVSLPSYIRSYTQYRRRFPADGVTAVLHGVSTSGRRFAGDITLVDADGAVVARMEGYEAVMSPTLFNAFRANTAA